MRNTRLRRGVVALGVAFLLTPVVLVDPPAAGAVGFTYVVNSTGDQDDAANDGLCRTAQGTCTLRAAIKETKYRSNTTARIEFNIPGNGPHRIQLSSQLPLLNKQTVPVTIDGYTQPGSVPNSSQYASNAVLKIHIRGTGEGSSTFTPILVTSSDNVIRGLAMTNSFKKIKVIGLSAQRNEFSGLWLGTDPSGTYGATTRTLYSNGIELARGTKFNVIGGPDLADRNVVSGNAGHGISMYDDGTDNNVVINNIVGLRPSGTARLANQVEGIDLNQNVAFNTIGGFGPNEQNVVSGNLTGGIESSHLQPGLGNRFNEFVNNWIGTTVDGNSATTYTDNGDAGITIQDGARDSLFEGNIIGGNEGFGIMFDPFGPGHETVRNVVRNNSIGVSRNGSAIGNDSHGIYLEDLAFENVIEDNVIANNGGRAIVFNSGWGSATGNTFTRNSMFGNGSGPSIDLPALGVVNQNDPGDTDSGPNGLLNFPVITDATPELARGTACANCTVELFDVGPGGSTSSNGPGRTFLAAVVADGQGNWSMSTDGAVEAGMVVTTTSTNPIGSTSEFSRNFRATED